MSLLGHMDDIVPIHATGSTPRTGTRLGPRHRSRGHDCPRGPDASYLLVDNDPEAPSPTYPLGWTLIGRQGTGPRRWSVALAAYGAGAFADPRVAKAVAVRVLAEHGVRIQDWSAAHDDALSAVYRAGPGREPQEPVRRRRVGLSPGH